MSKDWDALSGIGGGAALKEKSSTGVIEKKPKYLKDLPLSYFDDHKELKASGKTSLNFSAYIYEAVREKLERDKNG